MDPVLPGLRPEIVTLPESGIVEVVNYGRDHPDLIALWAGEGDKTTPAFIQDAAKQSLSDGETFYTYQRGHPDLRAALAAYHQGLYGGGRTAENFFVTGSGMQAIMNAVQALVGAGDNLVTLTPAWPNIFGAVQIAGGSTIAVPMQLTGDGWRADLDRLFDAVDDRTRALFVNSPSNPTGVVLTQEELIAIRDFARSRGIWIVADEVYGRFFYGNGVAAPSFLEIMEPEERLLVVNTFSKNWAMTGWRTGWVVAPAALGQVMENLVQYNTSGVPVFLQRGCIAALEGGEAFLAGQVAEVASNRALVCETLAQWDAIDLSPPDGAFYLFFRVKGATSSRDLAIKLIDETGVGLAPGGSFGEGGEGCLRLCLAGSPERFEAALERLAPVLG